MTVISRVFPCLLALLLGQTAHASDRPAPVCLPDGQVLWGQPVVDDGLEVRLDGGTVRVPAWDPDKPCPSKVRFRLSPRSVRYVRLLDGQELLAVPTFGSNSAFRLLDRTHVVIPPEMVELQRAFPSGVPAIDEPWEKEMRRRRAERTGAILGLSAVAVIAGASALTEVRLCFGLSC